LKKTVVTAISSVVTAGAIKCIQSVSAEIRLTFSDLGEKDMFLNAGISVEGVFFTMREADVSRTFGFHTKSWTLTWFLFWGTTVLLWRLRD
jgi:hypothetical protein